jgi:Rieske Fe-S protein
MSQESQQDQRTTRRDVLLGVGIAGAGGLVLAGCSTAAVAPYGGMPAAAAAGQGAPASGQAAAPGQNAGTGGGTGGGTATRTLLGMVTDIPVGGGKVFMSHKVVVTQPAKGVFKAFSAVCTHVGCVCNQVANGTINCPCHGSEFKIATGAVVTGPAPAPLPAAPINVSNGKIFLA